MKHKQKTKLARKMMSELDRKIHVPKFLTAAWLKRKEAIAKRVERKQAAAHKRAEERRMILPK